MPRAVKILHEKIRTAEGVVVEFKVWKVPKSANYPEGVKYSFCEASDGIENDQHQIQVGQ